MVRRETRLSALHGLPGLIASDISHGMESMPIALFNEVDETPPPQLDYLAACSELSTAAAEANMNSTQIWDQELAVTYSR